MTEENELEIIKEKYKHEIANFRRVVDRFDSLRNWLVTTSLASLAFMLTFLLQIRMQSPLPNVLLAEIAVGFLIFSVACALYTRSCHEISGVVVDIKNIAPLFPMLIEIVEKDKNSSEKEKAETIALLEKQIERTSSLENIEHNPNPYSELWRFIATGIALIIGLSTSCAYFWIYLF